MKARILNADGTVPGPPPAPAVPPAVPVPDPSVAPISNLLNGLWSKVVVSLNSTEVYSCSHYSHVSYLTGALMLPKQEHKRMDATEAYYLDTTPVDDIQTNLGWNARYQIYADGKIVELMGVLRIPIFGTSRFLPHGVRLDLALYTKAPSYFCQANHNDRAYQLEVTQCQLHYQSLDMTDDFLKECQLLFDRSRSASLPFLDYKTFTLNLKTGSSEASSPQYNLNAYPRRIFIGFVRERGFLGSYDTTPYNFYHFRANAVKVKLGEQELQQRTDQAQGANSELLFHMYKALGWTGQEGGCYVSRLDPVTFRNTHVYVFDCTPTMNSSCLEFYNVTPKSSIFSVDVSFAAALTENVTCFIMAEIDQVLAIAPDGDPVIFSPPTNE